MRITISFLICVLLVGAASCKSKTSKYRLAAVKDLAFQYNSSITGGGLGIYEHNDTELVYLIDNKTLKRISFFTKNGEPLGFIPIDSYSKIDPYINALQIISEDTVILISNKTNAIYQLNKIGTIIRQQHLPNLLNFYTINGALNDVVFLGRDELILHPILSARSTPDTFKNIKSAIGAEGVLRRAAPFFVTISNYWSSSPQVNYYIDSFYSRFIPVGKVFQESSGKYAIAGDHALLAGQYSDTIYKYSLKSFHLQKSVALHSKYAVIGLPPSSVDSFLSYPKQKLMAERASILNLCYDKFRDQYYVAIIHPCQTAFNSRPWSIIVLDKDFAQKAEFFIKEDTYYPAQIIVTKEGLLLGKMHSNLPGNYQSFTLFKVEK